MYSFIPTQPMYPSHLMLFAWGVKVCYDTRFAMIPLVMPLIFDFSVAQTL